MLSIANTISSKADYPEITEILGGSCGFLVGLKPEEGEGHRSPFQRKKEKKIGAISEGAIASNSLTAVFSESVGDRAIARHRRQLDAFAQ
jgi:hypothetical protein